MAFYLAFKEVWRNRSRYLLFSLVIALITILVLFIAALAGGLANANKQFIDKLDAELLVFQEKVDLLSSSSRLDESTLRRVRRVEGVADAGPLGFSNTTIVFSDARESVDVTLIGVEPGRVGTPRLLAGPGLLPKRNNEVVIDSLLARQTGIQVNDRIQIKSTQGADEEIYDLRVVGITEEQRYFYAPSIFVSLTTWDEVRPQATAPSGRSTPIFNVIAIKLSDPAALQNVSASMPQLVDGIEVADKATSILALPGYSAQQSTLNTQQFFTLLIGVLVVGGFFQIQTLQKVAQIGMLKAIGSSNPVVAGAAMLQIILVTILGVSMGVVGTLLLVLGLPDNLPVVFTGSSIAAAVGLLLMIGPFGGLVSIRLALKIDPLTAIGLSS